MALNQNFINEMFKSCLRRQDILEVVTNNVKENQLPSVEYVKIFKRMKSHFEKSGNVTTLGSLSQHFDRNDDVLSVLDEIKLAEEIKSTDLIHQIEEYIKNQIFIETYNELHGLFQSGDRDKAFDLMNEISTKWKDFSVVKNFNISRIFGEFSDRYSDRIDELEIKSDKAQKIPTGIFPLDKVTHGGIDKGDTLLFLADSGVGKSKALKHLGLQAARRGFKVIHIQAEGTKAECEASYDAAIAGCSVTDIEFGNLDDEKVKQVIRATKMKIAEGGEIFVKAFEQFDSGTMLDVRDFILQVQDNYGKVDLIVLDYIDEIDPDNNRYPNTQEGVRLKRAVTAKKFKNICVEFNIAGATATQAGDIPDKQKEDPEFVLKRGNTSENRKLLQPFSYLISLNRTSEENENDEMRLYADKVRKYGVVNRTLHIVTNFNNERFYNHSETIKRFGI